MSTNIDRSGNTRQVGMDSRRANRAKPMLALVGICVLQFMACDAALAASACIADGAGLTAAMNFLSKKNEVSTINLEENTYQLGAIDIQFLAPIQIVGGFKPGTLCATHEDNSSKTIIDFGGSANKASFTQLRGSPNALLAFSDLTLRNGQSFELLAGEFKTAPYLGQHDHPGAITMSHVRITNFGWVDYQTYNGQAVFSDMLFDHIHPGGACAVTTVPMDNNTYVFNHVTMDLTGGKDLCFSDDNDTGDWNYTITNSIIWASDGTVSAVRGLNNDWAQHGDLTNVTIDHTLYKGYVGSGTWTVTNQISSDPLWVNPAGADYHLKYPPQQLSPAINTATSQVPGAEPATDIEGALRKIGSKADLGAYESPYSDASSFSVTNATDCSAPGCGSLRDAINLATNSAAATASINFNIAGGCPAVINLGSPLPDITKPIAIDGYTQPSSVKNTDLYAFNATLCVVVQPVSVATSYYAFRVPANSSGSLSLSGIGVGAFPVGIELFGGSGHQITGNQFGGYINNFGFQLYGSTVDAIYMDAPNGQISIGGPDPASRNVFLNTFSYTAVPAAAINIGAEVNGAHGACQIVGNTLGVQDDGTFASKNLDYGIYMQGSNCFLGGNRIVGVNKDAIFIDGVIGGGNNNVVQNNTLGLVPYGFDLSSSNAGAGVRVSGVHNVIGASTSNGGTSAYANQIRYMDGGGVVVTGNNSYGNTIRGNAMLYNGPGGDGMSIDLGGDGPTINDISDSDTGPNDRQNFPTLHGVVWASTPALGATNLSAVVSGTLRTFPGYFYQVDVYYSEGCDAVGKGMSEQWIGSNDFVSLPAQTYNVPFSAQVTIPTYLPAYGALSVTATNDINGEGSTSEMSTCFPIDTIFRDGAEGGYGFD